MQPNFSRIATKFRSGTLWPQTGFGSVHPHSAQHTPILRSPKTAGYLSFIDNNKWFSAGMNRGSCFPFKRFPLAREWWWSLGSYTLPIHKPSRYSTSGTRQRTIYGRLWSTRREIKIKHFRAKVRMKIWKSGGKVGLAKDWRQVSWAWKSRKCKDDRNGTLVSPAARTAFCKTPLPPPTNTAAGAAARVSRSAQQQQHGKLRRRVWRDRTAQLSTAPHSACPVAVKYTDFYFIIVSF